MTEIGDIFTLGLHLNFLFLSLFLFFKFRFNIFHCPNGNANRSLWGSSVSEVDPVEYK